LPEDQLLDVVLEGHVQKLQAVVYGQLSAQQLCAHLLQRGHLKVFGRIQQFINFVGSMRNFMEVHPLQDIMKDCRTHVRLLDLVDTRPPLDKVVAAEDRTQDIRMSRQDVLVSPPLQVPAFHHNIREVVVVVDPAQHVGGQVDRWLLNYLSYRYRYLKCQSEAEVSLLTDRTAELNRYIYSKLP
jgi:hypothetical protein